MPRLDEVKRQEPIALKIPSPTSNATGQLIYWRNVPYMWDGQAWLATSRRKGEEQE